MKFLHTADWQLGMTRHFLDADAQPRYSDARVRAVQRIGEIAEREGCDFILVCGDVFETNQVPDQVIARACQNLRGSVPVYLLPGNHDPLDSGSIYTSAALSRRLPENVHILLEPGLQEVGPGVDLVAAPWFSKHPTADLAAEAMAGVEPEKGRVRIVAGHGAVSSLNPDRDSAATIDQSALEAALRAGEIDFVALGDRHSCTNVGKSGRIWYSGTPEVTDFTESAPGHVLIVSIEPGAACTVEQVTVGQWQFVQVSAAVDSDADVSALLARLDALEPHDRVVVRLSLVGTLGIAAKARLDAGLAELEHSFASIRLWQRHTNVAVVADEQALSDLGLGGYADDAVAALSAQAATGGTQEVPEEVQAARDALGLLYRLVGPQG